MDGRTIGVMALFAGLFMVMRNAQAQPVTFAPDYVIDPATGQLIANVASALAAAGMPPEVQTVTEDIPPDETPPDEAPEVDSVIIEEQQLPVIYQDVEIMDMNPAQMVEIGGLQGTAKLDFYLENNNVQAWLMAIRRGESSLDDSAYSMLYGGTDFLQKGLDYSRHPNVRVMGADGAPHTPAGAYQIIYKTWVGIAQKWGLTDFSPLNQDRAAVALTISRGALKSVLAGNWANAVKLAANEWASLPGSGAVFADGTMQPTQKMANFLATIQMYGGDIGAGSGGVMV